MIIQALEKIKQQTIISSLLLMIVGLLMLIIPVQHDDKTMMCRTDQIYYIESVDKRSFVYTKAGCYETKHRLYELEELLDSRFLRSAKAMIVNIRKIRSVKGEINGRMRAELLNGEQIVISRGYVKELKEKLGV